MKGTITPDRERLNVANKMADKKKSASQSEVAESKVRSGEKEQNKSAKAAPREREQRRERQVKESKSAKRESKQSPTFWARFRNYRPVRFVREAYHELRYKVTWPTFPEARNMTFVVIALSAAIGLLLWIADLGLFKLFQLISGK
jgi:preprotein translocase SecE subunit